MKSYDDITSENVNLRQHLGKLVTDKDDLQRQIDFLRQQIADIANPAAAALRQQGYPISTVGSPLPQTVGVTSTTVSAVSQAAANPTPAQPPVQGRLTTPAQASSAVVPSNTTTPSGTLHVGVSGQSTATTKGAAFHVQKMVGGQPQSVQLTTTTTTTTQELSKAQFVGHVHPHILPHALQQHQPPQQPQPSKPQPQQQLEIIHVPVASATASVKPSFEHFIVDSAAAAVTIPRSAESTSPQPLTLTSVQATSDVGNGFGSPGTIQKKSLDALVLAIQQIEGTSMGGSPEETKDQLGCNSCSNTNDLINNNNNNNNKEDTTHTDENKLKNNNKNVTINNNNNDDARVSTYIIEDVAELEQSEIVSAEVKREPSSEGETPANGGASDEYPIVTKLLNRPIPHKYLHRPQVVVNSSH